MKFYKIIKSANVEKSKLKLPSKFVARFGNQVPNTVTLQVPNEAKWRVRVRKNDDGGAWLIGKGWAEFINSLSLGYADFLMFEYDAISAVFHVVVMGMSASEIKYPALATDDDPEDDDDDDVVLLSSRSKKGPTPLASKLPKESKPKFEFENTFGNPYDVENKCRHKTPEIQAVKKREAFYVYYAETILNDEGRIQCVIQGRKVYEINDAAEQALARARAFKANEPHFIISLQPTFVSGNRNINRRRSQLLVPPPFIEAYFNLEVKNVILEAPDRRTWTVVQRQSAHCIYFASGWKQFSEKYGLTVGDSCLFELIIGEGNALKVAIFRTTGEDEVPISHS